MNDLVLNLLPVGANRNIGKISSGMGMSVFNAPMFDSGSQIKVPTIPKIFGAPPNGGGGWAGSGILGTYYSNNNFTGSSFQRTDVRIDMPPTTVLPGGSLATDPVFGVVGATNFSVKWVGSLLPKYTETYILKLKTGGTSLILKIGGVTIATATSSSGWVTASYAFASATTYSVEVDYVQGTGPWGAQVHWLSAANTPFPEEAIGPATPIGVNLSNEDQNCPANGGLVASYGTTFSDNSGPSLDSSGWPTGDFVFNQMSTPNDGAAYAFPNVGFASDGRTGVWTILFNGAAELYTNNTGVFLIGHNDGSRTSVALNSLTYYSYGQDLPLSALTWHSGTGTGYNPATNQTVVLFDLRGGGWDNVGFRSTDRNGKGAPGGPTGTAVPGLTNVACMRPSSVGSTTSLLPGTVINPAYLATCAPYVCHRCLLTSYNADYVASLTSPRTDWQNRNTPIFNMFASVANQYGNSPPTLPWEISILKANLSGKDLYVNFPQTASGNASDSDYASSYLYQLASLMKNGSTYNGVHYPGLLPHLSVYLEYANENWNWSAGQLPEGSFHNIGLIAYNNKQANTQDWQQYSAMGGVVVGPDDNSHNIALWCALKVKDASDLFRLVYGDAAMPGGPSGYNPDPRIRPIYEWQYGGSFSGLGTAFDSLNAVESYYGIPVNHIYWGGGGGWYVVMKQTAATVDQLFADITPASVLAVWATSMPTGYVNSVQQDVDILAQHGLHQIAYEGGFAIGWGDTPPSDAIQTQTSNDSRSTPYVKLVVDNYFQVGGSLPVVFYATGGAYGFGSDYAVIDGMWDQPPYASAPPKLQGYFNCTNSLPAPAVAPPAWVVVPNYFPVQYGRTTDRPPYQTQTFVVNSPGFYLVGFDTQTPYVTTSTVDFTVVIDGVTVLSGRTINPNGGDSFWTPVYLAAGVHGYVVNVANFSPPLVSASVTFNPWGVVGA